MIYDETKEVGVLWNLADVDAAIDVIREDDEMEFVPHLTEDEKFEALKELNRYFENGYAPDYGDLDHELRELYKDRLYPLKGGDIE